MASTNEAGSRDLSHCGRSRDLPACPPPRPSLGSALVKGGKVFTLPFSTHTLKGQTDRQTGTLEAAVEVVEEGGG